MNYLSAHRQVLLRKRFTTIIKPRRAFYGITLTDMHKLILSSKTNKCVIRNSSIQVWDSSVAIDEDYLRACLFNRRHGFLLSDGKLLVSNGAYFNCKDYIHAGKVIVMQKSQILYNHLCNRHLLQLRKNKIIND